MLVSSLLVSASGLFLYIRESNDANSDYQTVPLAADSPIGAQYDDISLFLSPIKQVPSGTALKATGLIVPHHLLASPLIAEAFSRLSSNRYQDIVLLSPDHFSAGQTDISVTERDFATVFGKVETDKDLVRQLEKIPGVSAGDFFYREHGLQAILPFIRYYFPESKVIAITFRAETTRAELDRLIGVLGKGLPANSLIIESTDFSHYLKPEEAAQRDEASIQAIRAGDPDSILALDQPANIDSVAALYVQAALQKSFFAAKPIILEHKNSQAYSLEPISSSTSYITAVYSQPEKTAESRLIFVGDVMLSRYIGEMMAKRQDYTFPFQQIGPFLTGADMIFGNLESPISSSGASTGSLYPFRAEPAVADGLRQAGFTVLSVANNHAFDYGLTAFADTLDNLRKSGLAYTGGGRDFVEAHQGAELEINGTKITILAYTDLLPRSWEAGAEKAGFAYLDETQMTKDIRAAKEKSDLVIVSFHWGREYETKSNARQQALAAVAAQAGASLIIGHHPHVRQEIAQVQGVTVAYSLGNFIFDQNFSPETETGLALLVKVKDKKIESIEPYTVNFNRYFQPFIK